MSTACLLVIRELEAGVVFLNFILYDWCLHSCAGCSQMTVQAEKHCKAADITATQLLRSEGKFTCLGTASASKADAYFSTAQTCAPATTAPGTDAALPEYRSAYSGA